MSGATTIQDQVVTLPPSHSLSLTLPEGLSFDQWQHFGRELCRQQRSVNWLIGDWWNFGVAKYGDFEARRVALELWGVESETARVYGWVASKFDPVSRLTNVPFSQYQEVASLAPEKAETILRQAEEKNLSRAEVRAKVRAAKGTPRDVALSARDDDPEYYAALNISRPWNREDVGARQIILDQLLTKFAPELVGTFEKTHPVFEDIDL